MSRLLRCRAAAGRAVLLAALALGATGPSLAHQAVDPAILRLVKPRLTVPRRHVDRRPGSDLVEQGRRLFFQETFGGNGRTCGTCHPANNNFTIDPPFVQRLHRSRPRDPLFVAEYVPALAGLENPRLLREHALVLENLDGFDRPGVLRGVPHTLGLGSSTGPANPPNDLAGATGWSGDGAPGSGTLKEFALGAVVQHFPKTLQRRPGVDFIVPTDAQLEALLAFQLSTGRQGEMNLDPSAPGALAFLDPVVARGQSLFHGDPDPAPPLTPSRRSCAACHSNGGANTAGGTGLNVDTGVRLLANAPACLPSAPYPPAPADGGLGVEPGTATLCGTARPSFGNGRFNTPSVIEAADTPPFFHNNGAATIEDAVRFYTGDAFAASPAGQGQAPAGGRFVLSAEEIVAVAAFLRAINALDNIDSASRVLAGAIRRPTYLSVLRSPARHDIDDAIEVLTRGPRTLYPDRGPVLALLSARTRIDRGQLAEARRDLARASALIARARP